MELKSQSSKEPLFKSKDVFFLLNKIRVDAKYFISTINGFKPTSEVLVLENFSNFYIKGWAVDIESNVRASKVFICFDEKKFFEANYGISSPSVAKSFNNNKFENCGFELRIPFNLIGKGIFKVSIWIVSLDKCKYYKTGKRMVYIK